MPFQPSFVMSGGLAAGVLLASRAGGATAWWLALAATLLAGAVLTRRRALPGVAWPLWLAAASLAAGGLLYRAEQARWAGGLAGYTGAEVGLRGVVVGEPAGNRPPTAVLAVEQVGRGGSWERGGGRVAVVGRAVRGWSYGERVEVRGLLRGPRGAREEATLRRRGAAFVLEARESLRLGGRGGARIVALARGLKEKLEGVFRATLPPEAAGMLAGLVLGDRSGLARGLSDDFRRAGLAHVLAVSGLHVGFVAGALLAALRPLRLGPWGRTAALLPALSLYALVTGAAAPVVRATLMFAAGLVGRCLGRPGTGGQPLALAFCAMVAGRPSWLFDPGFQLSFAATVGIFHGAPRLLAALRGVAPGLPPWVGEGLAVTLAAQAATLPLVVHYFGAVSPVAPLANLAVVPLVGLAVPLGFAAGLAGLVAEPVAWLVNRFTGLLLAVTAELVHWFAGWPGASLALPRLPPWAVTLCYAVPALWWLRGRIKAGGGRMGLSRSEG